MMKSPWTPWCLALGCHQPVNAVSTPVDIVNIDIDIGVGGFGMLPVGGILRAAVFEDCGFVAVV